MRTILIIMTWVLATIFILPITTHARDKSYSLQDVLSAPFPSDLVASQKSDRFAWVENDRGIRNIWTAAAPEFKRQKLTDFNADDGQALYNLILSSDGEKLYFTSGGKNPESLAHPKPRQIWQITIQTGEIRKIADGHSGLLSPNDQYLIFRQNTGLKILDLQSGSSPKTLLNVRKGIGQISWSPDSQKITFISPRGRYNFVGWFPIDGHKVNWIEPAVNRDLWPAWSPDSQKIAFVRLPGYKSDERPDSSREYPLELWVADINKNQARKLWLSPDDAGGYSQLGGLPLAWVSNDQLIFQSEHENWLKHYKINIEKGSPKPVFPGQCEILHSVVSPVDQSLYFTNNCNDIHRRHIWSYNFKNNKITKITRGKKIATMPAVSGNKGYVAYLSATAQKPMGIIIADKKGKVIKDLSASSNETFPVAELIEPKAIEITAADGLVSYGQLFMPKDAKPDGNHPAIIFYHGGSHRQMLLGWHGVRYYSYAYGFNQYMAKKGYVVLALNYRAGTGYGRSFRNAENQGPRGASEYQDAIAAGEYLRDLPEVNPAKIGVYGGSYGGVMTGMSLSRDSSLFSAGVAIHGVYDWAYRERDFYKKHSLKARNTTKDSLAYKSSPIAGLDYWSSPVLLISGDDDSAVMFEQTVNLAQHLKEKNVHVETLVFPDEEHDFLRFETTLQTYKATEDFFNRFLGETK